MAKKPKKPLNKADDISVLNWSQCATCARKRPGLFCDAFVFGIPEEILFNLVDHRLPYKGDLGLRYVSDGEAQGLMPLTGK